MILESPVVGKLRSLVREISETATPLDEQVAFQREHFVASLLVFLPESQGDGALGNPKVVERDVGQPAWQFRIYIKRILVSIRVQSEDRGETRSQRPTPEAR